MTQTTEFAYKILTQGEREELEALGRFVGSADDRRDGFIHLSFAHQVRGTLDKHFAGQRNLSIAQVALGSLGRELKLETSRGGESFPHLYRELESSEVVGWVDVSEF